ncbi:hypothetical protein CKAH01_05249 [Colletotrichum kahawae]|uniref:Heterokaryon incompatibility domain-containing protein n=1 Tax=Colletotrichum kahawae TaxID=34407 RepID=A0AAD9YD31_COLKA|nr:hypothetical protein CKAH01_05249 [Colletotrichum kahawae]
MPSSSKYRYFPLQPGRCIRAIQLLPSPSPEAPLQCYIREIDIDSDDGLAFEAISYTWGPPVFDHVLYVNRQESFFTITESLSDALRCFRLKDRPRIIWADAVCINQQDNREKSSQIPLMADIYRRAESVLVWLGKDASAESAMRSLNWMGRSASSELERIERNKIISSLGTLLRQPWFSRRWIIQEVVRNQDVTMHCRSASLSWVRLIATLTRLGEDFGTSNQLAVQALGQMRNLWKRIVLLEDSGAGHTLLENFHSFSHFGCANPRDHIFALAALSSDVTMSQEPKYPKKNAYVEPVGTVCWANPKPQERMFRIIPDYDMSTEEVYMAFAAEVARNGLFSWLLSRTWGQLPTEGLPAWAPDWRTTNPNMPYFAKQLLNSYTGREEWGSNGLPMMADWPKTRRRGNALRLRSFSVLLRSKMLAPPQAWERPEDTVYVRPLWKSKPLNFKTGMNCLEWVESFSRSTYDFLKSVNQSPFDSLDVNDAFFCLWSYLLGYGPNTTHWCDDKASVLEKIRAHGVQTDASAFSKLNGGHFAICAQGQGEQRATFLAYTPVDLDISTDMLIRPETSLSLGMRAVQPRVRPVRVSLIMQERVDLKPSQPWTNSPLGVASNCFKLRGQALIVGIQKDSSPYGDRKEGTVYKHNYDFDMC